MNRIIQTVSCFLCCLLTMLTLCSCQTEAANNDNTQEDKIILGDADCDSDISIMDVTTIQRYLAGVSVPSFDQDAADTNGSGDVEITDGTLIQRHLVGISVPYKIGELISDQENQGDEPFTLEQTGMTDPVPSTYLSAAQHGGSVQRIEYDSMDYAGSGDPVKKQAYVYLPYGYDEADADTRYNILYLMHGWGGHAGEYFEYANIKNIFDNMIANGDIESMIVVSATFYHDNTDRDFGSSEDALRAFHNDFEKHLMPAVEGQFHTYAKSTSDEDLKASRDHRAFGGFSLGSVTTWLQFCYDYDYIRYFLPMSGSSWYYGTYGDFQIEKMSISSNRWWRITTSTAAATSSTMLSARRIRLEVSQLIWQTKCLAAKSLPRITTYSIKKRAAFTTTTPCASLSIMPCRISSLNKTQLLLIRNILRRIQKYPRCRTTRRLATTAS